jgi:L-serine dehydratase
MAVSVFDLFKVGIGPSSSHTVGPMKAALQFAIDLAQKELLSSVRSVQVELFGSLGATGIGHGTDKAILLGLEGNAPDQIDPIQIAPTLDRIRGQHQLFLLGQQPIGFEESKHLKFHFEALSFHPNGMRFTAFSAVETVLLSEVYYSVGGGFIVNEEQLEQNQEQKINPTLDPTLVFPYPFHCANELLALCQTHQLSISQMMLKNEAVWQSESAVKQGLLHIWNIMQQCVQNGCQNEGVLPGGLNIKRRAPELYRQLSAAPSTPPPLDPLRLMDWVNLFAIAVNEENAAGGRVVTAPTNGAAGILPAVLHYYTRFCPGATDDRVVDFLLTAGAIGILYKENASISGADVGCQGEVGVACSMAAGALTEVLGGTPQQVENAAEIAMEHHLGLTCDPIAGLVQIPCIERNAMGAMKAINAARIALQGDGKHFVSLDQVIQTMRTTGADMHNKYKETALGGLAVNVIEC